MVKREAKKADSFSAAQYDDARASIDVALNQVPDDPVLEALKHWDCGEQKPTTFRLRPEGEPLVMTTPEHARAAGVREGFFLGSDSFATPNSNASALAAYRAEYSGVLPYSGTIIGLGSTDYRKLLEYANWMTLHHPLAKNVIRALKYLTIGQGITVAWPGDRNGTGGGREKSWKAIERTTGFHRQVARISHMVFGLGEWFAVPAYDKRRSGSPSLPNRVLHIEPDRITRILVNEADAEDVVGYEIQSASSALAGKGADEVIHAKAEDYGNVCRGITPLLPALKYLRYAELFVEGRHYLNLTRSRLPVIRKIKGSGSQIQREKSRLTKLPAPGTIWLDPEAYEWQFPSLQINSADATDDWTRIILAIAAAVGLPAHMVANDVSQGTYASTLISESPTIRMIEDYREFFVETWISELVRKLSGRDDGFSISFAPVIRRSIGELAQAVTVLVQTNVISRRTGCEVLGYDWEGADGEKSRIEQERDEGFGEAMGFGELKIPTELPNTRPPEPTTGAALGAKGSSLPKQSAT